MDARRRRHQLVYRRVAFRRHLSGSGLPAVCGACIAGARLRPGTPRPPGTPVLHASRPLLPAFHSQHPHSRLRRLGRSRRAMCHGRCGPGQQPFAQAGHGSGDSACDDGMRRRRWHRRHIQGTGGGHDVHPRGHESAHRHHVGDGSNSRLALRRTHMLCANRLQLRHTLHAIGVLRLAHLGMGYSLGRFLRPVFGVLQPRGGHA